jgi:hypothetical protein
MASPDTAPSNPPPAETARHLMRSIDRASLATHLTTDNGIVPYASLVLVAADLDASPLLFISDIAEHTKNLKRDPKASLLFDGTAGLAETLTGSRVTVVGEIAPDSDPVLRARFVRRHPSAELYAGFHDFHLYRMCVTRAHLVAGFGRIHWIDSDQLLHRSNDTAWLRDAEPDILEHMNGDHAATIDLYAQRLLGLTGTGWRMTGVDPEGADLRSGGTIARLMFPTPIVDPDGIRQVFIALAQSARSGGTPQ